MANCKTPVSILQELCAKKGVTPVYDTIGQEGASHQPKFTIRCTAGDVVGNGQGSSKKVAKQSAAEDVLQQLDVEVPAVEDEGRSLKDNPVGELQELVTLLGWRKPEYEALEESGPPHNRRFVIAVSVDKYKEQGVDQSKRLAKRAAATTMLEVLHKLPADINPGLINRKPKQKHPKMPGPHRLAIKNLPQAEGNFIRSLKMNALNFPDPSYSSMLQDLGQEQSFKVEHVPHRGADQGRPLPVLRQAPHRTRHRLLRQRPLPQRRHGNGIPQCTAVLEGHGDESACAGQGECRIKWTDAH
ncbi:RISC-loading complex subunit tarbp2-like [Lytechinus variegatus]|uniref:RISC-loading complex subunit tarbp2-like n=1 Tax=Lytechinus variegatus TaxID=7654 RepID=UPI001BB2C198|nr:RISC-loading complex subunit tarbp2-like [Lytechinus variegatus]